MNRCLQCQGDLPEPRTRFCIHCGAEHPSDPLPEPETGTVDAPEAPAAESRAEGPPPEPAPSLRTDVAAIPWERRAEIGALSALLETTVEVLGSPAAFFRRLQDGRSAAARLAYALLTGMVGVLAAALYEGIFRALVPPGTVEGPLARWMGQGGEVGLVARLLLGPIVLLGSVVVAAAVSHALLVMFGAARRPFEASLGVTCYAEAAAVLNVVPFCGWPLATAYTLVLMVIGLSEAHQTGRGTAAAAVLLPVFGLCCCCGGLGLLAAMAGLPDWP